jgi:soluble P-type ATPase
MIEIDIPGRGELRLRFLIADYNGTLACDGIPIPEVIPLLGALSANLEIHIVTADTFGCAAKNLRELPVTLTILPPDRQDQGKADYLRQLGAQSAVCVGNGRNDLLMLRDAALGICVTEAEGACIQTLQAADIVCRHATDALNLLLNPKRLIATLRM